jgi:putative transposase
MDNIINKDKLTHARTCVYNVNYHIVWSVKYRRNVLKGGVEKRFKEVLKKVADDKEFIIQTMEVMPDHVHLFVSAHPKISPSYIVKMSKGITGRLLLKEFPLLQEKLWDGKLWNPSYYLETVGNISEATVEKYIENQKSK